MKKILIVLALMSIVLFSGCYEEIEVECEDLTDCEYKDGVIKKCVENECVYQECYEELDCNRYSISINWEKCIEGKCVDFRPECKEIATKDYNYKSPECDYTYSDECFCKDMKITRDSQEIERNNSIEIIDARWSFDNFVTFKMKR